MIPLAEAIEILRLEGIACERSDAAKVLRAGRIPGRLDPHGGKGGGVAWLVDLDALREWRIERENYGKTRSRYLEAEADDSPIRIARLWGRHPTRGRIHAAAIIRERGKRAARRIAQELAETLRAQGAVEFGLATVVPVSSSASGFDW
jgi:hypothetical protein